MANPQDGLENFDNLTFNTFEIKDFLLEDNIDLDTYFFFLFFFLIGIHSMQG